MNGWFWITIILTSPFLFVLAVVILIGILSIIAEFFNIIKVLISRGKK